MSSMPCRSIPLACRARSRRVVAAAAAGAVGERVDACVARDFALAPAAVMAATRGAPRAALARQVAMYLAHVVHRLDFAAVGRLFGRDRTTVSHACRLVEDLRDDAWFDRRVAALERACRAPASAMRQGGRR
jgi:chromosomal replication initiation ATPase DnaA